MKRTAGGKSGKVSRARKRASKNVARRPKPTKEAPFGVDVLNDGDIVSPRRELSEDEIKEQEDRRS